MKWQRTSNGYRLDVTHDELDWISALAATGANESYEHMDEIESIIDDLRNVGQDFPDYPLMFNGEKLKPQDWR